MNTVLILITLVSVATAIVALVSLLRLRRQERERSEARVAALSAAAEGGEGVPDRGLGVRASAETRMTEPITIPQSLMPSSQSLVPVVLVALVVVVGAALVFLNTSEDRAAASLSSPAPPLELVALGHEIGAKQLTISGTVRNPLGGSALDGLTAVVSLLDGSGALLSTRDVPLDFRALGPGEETPFRLVIPDPGSLARYRVSFRAGTAVVPHVDRRNHTKLASARE